MANFGMPMPTGFLMNLHKFFLSILNGTVSPDYKCLEVISVKSPLLGHVIPDIKKSFKLFFSFSFHFHFIFKRHNSALKKAPNPTLVGRKTVQ
jgi:hypothetical protein